LKRIAKKAGFPTVRAFLDVISKTKFSPVIERRINRESGGKRVFGKTLRAAHQLSAAEKRMEGGSLNRAERRLERREKPKSKGTRKHLRKPAVRRRVR
jgi:hypothetical protein